MCVRNCAGVRERRYSRVAMKSELICQLSLKSLAESVSLDTLSTCLSTQGGHKSEVKEAAAVSFVGGSAATEEQAFPNHNLSKSPHMQIKCAGLRSERSTAARSPSAVSPRAGRTADCRMTERIKTQCPIQGDTQSSRDFLMGAAPLSCPARHNNPFLKSCSSVLTSSPQLVRGSPASKSTPLARLCCALSLKTKLVWPKATAAATEYNIITCPRHYLIKHRCGKKSHGRY